MLKKKKDSRCQRGINPPLWRFPCNSINCICRILFGLLTDAHSSTTFSWRQNISICLQRQSKARQTRLWSYNVINESDANILMRLLLVLLHADGLSLDAVFGCRTCDILDYVVTATPDLDCAKVPRWRTLLSEGGPQSALLMEIYSWELPRSHISEVAPSHQTWQEMRNM